MIGLGSLMVFFALAVLVSRSSSRRRRSSSRSRTPMSSSGSAATRARSAPAFTSCWPFLDVIRYRHSLKEAAFDIPAQVCITRDNVQVGVDGILYLKVLNAERASYGISDYLFAITQLAQTTLRSEIGKIDLDKTFEERTNINMSVVTELDKASESWGVKVLRYEIKNITPPHDILAAMEKQMRAEREKRAVILTSEGARDAVINNAEGAKQETIKNSEARRQQQINEAEGQASAILAVATATAEGIRRVANAMQDPGGAQAVQLRVAEQYITQFGQLAKESNTLVIPANAADVGLDDWRGHDASSARRRRRHSAAAARNNGAAGPKGPAATAGLATTPNFQRPIPQPLPTPNSQSKLFGHWESGSLDLGHWEFESCLTTYTCSRYNHSIRRRRATAETEQARTADHGGAVDPRRLLGARDPGSLSREGPAGLHHRADDGLPAGREGRHPPHEEDRQRAHLRGGHLAFAPRSAA